jgi:hypothetical protein
MSELTKDIKKVANNKHNSEKKSAKIEINKMSPAKSQSKEQ